MKSVVKILRLLGPGELQIPQRHENGLGWRPIMQPDTIDYRRPQTPPPHRPVIRLLIRSLGAILFMTSLACCIMTWRTPGRLGYIPWGDVGLGFRSYAGWLQWIEYAPWEKNPDYVEVSLPWAVWWFAELLLVAATFIPWQREAEWHPA